MVGLLHLCQIVCFAGSSGCVYTPVPGIIPGTADASFCFDYLFFIHDYVPLFRVFWLVFSSFVILCLVVLFICYCCFDTQQLLFVCTCTIVYLLPRHLVL